jgi:hypothetical protein
MARLEFTVHNPTKISAAEMALFEALLVAM